MGNSRNRTNDAVGPYIPRSGECGRRKFKRGPKRPAAQNKYGHLSLDERVKARVAAQMPLKSAVHPVEMKFALMNVHPSKYQRAWKKHMKSIHVETNEQNGTRTINCDRCNGCNIERHDGRGKTVVDRQDIVTLPGGIRCTACLRWWV